jgi:hypothetical protein
MKNHPVKLKRRKCSVQPGWPILYVGYHRWRIYSKDCEMTLQIPGNSVLFTSMAPKRLDGHRHYGSQ